MFPNKKTQADRSRWETKNKRRLAHFIHRPLSTYLNNVIQEGCTLQKVIEPQLDEAIARQYQAEKYGYVPGYIVIYATKSS